MNITKQSIEKLEKDFDNNKKYKLVQNIVSTSDIDAISKKHEQLHQLEFDFNHSLPEKVIATKQGQAGTCWIFAFLNVLRHKMIKKYRLPPDYQLSQAYVFKWDKFEKCNYALEILYDIKNKKCSKYLKSLEYSTLAKFIISDGGTWEMCKNTISKYGIVPETAFPSNSQVVDTTKINYLLKMIISKSSAYINEKNMKRDEFDIYKKKILSKCYRIINICTGKTPSSFEFNNKKYTPLSFNNKIIVPLINMENYVSISSIPTRRFNKTYVTEYGITVLPELPPGDDSFNLKKMIGTSDFNVDEKTFKSAITKCIDNHASPVFIAVNIDHFMIEYNSILDPKSSILSDIFDMDFSLSKNDGFKSNTNTANHAMVIVGYNEEKDGIISRWKVENSYGKNGKYDGMCLMTKEWFDNYTTIAVVPLDCLHPNLRERAKNRENVKYVSFWD